MIFSLYWPERCSKFMMPWWKHSPCFWVIKVFWVKRMEFSKFLWQYKFFIFNIFICVIRSAWLRQFCSRSRYWKLPFMWDWSRKWSRIGTANFISHQHVWSSGWVWVPYRRTLTIVGYTKFLPCISLKHHIYTF